MTDVSFRNVLPKKFRYYAKSLLKKNETINADKVTQGDATETESKNTKSDTKSDDHHNESFIHDSPTDKNVLPTPPGSPDDDPCWTTSSVDSGSAVNSPNSPMSLLSALEHHRIEDLRISSNEKLHSNTKGDDAEVAVSQNYLRAIPSVPGIPFIPGDLDNPIIARALASSAPRRQRGEKKPIPSEQKDDRYFERRKRNNMAAKKSRDARKAREDQIAVRANLLEKENAILRAQVSTLRDEANSLRQLLVRKRSNRM